MLFLAQEEISQTDDNQQKEETTHALLFGAGDKPP
jgi:hypothetical protein